MKERGGETEKVTINIGYVDLGRIDLLVQDGFFTNRSDFIRTAVRQALSVHATDISRTIERHTLELGFRDYSVSDLEAVKARGQLLHIKVVGLARIAPEVSPELALQAIASITILGSLDASKEVKLALAHRISYRASSLPEINDPV